MDAQQTTLYYAILIAVVLIGIILAFFIILLIRNHRRNIALYKSKLNAEITTLENERKRMAADLHDEIGPVLAGIKMKLDSISTTDPEDQEILIKAKKNLYDMMAKMKAISNDLLPTVLVQKGIVAAVDAFLDDIKQKNGVDIKFNHQVLPSLPENLSVHIYRIIQEIVHNTIKHAHAKKLDINLSHNDNTIVLETKDDGSGFDKEKQLKENFGLGLRNVLSRTDVMGGIMYLETEPNKGTCYTIEVPLK